MIGETMCRDYAARGALATAVLRIFSVYGPGLRRQLLWDVAQKALAGPVVTLSGTGEETRDFVHVEDLMAAIDAVAARGPEDGSAVNVASGRSVTTAEVSRLLVEGLGTGARVEFDGRARPGDPPRWSADVGRLRALGFEPRVPLEDGVRGYASWILAQE
jgi:UDP-glucose 4-epimerase